MAIPSGSGTEVLKVALGNALNATPNKIIDGVANHIYTILSVSICETNGTESVFNMYIADDGGSTHYEILADTILPADNTYVYNDRIVLSGTDELIVAMNGSCNVDIVCSYIDQDWT